MKCRIQTQWLTLALVAASGVWAGCDSTPTFTDDDSACPITSSTFAKVNQATYAVVVEAQTGPGPNDVGYFTLGTAFAIDNRLLATNAHVTEFFNGLTGVAVTRVLAVQSGTGDVVTLLRALTHPDYNQNPLTSPDVGLFTTQEALPATLPIATEAELRTLSVSNELLLAGFPGDVQDLFDIIPGTTVPQATSLTGRITALRAHDPNVVVSQDTTDVIQHQIPTTPGTSGSALVRCGKVAAVHNAGTVKLVVTVQSDGTLAEDRTAAANNNFGVHAKFLTEMVDLFKDQSIQGFELPPPFIPGGGGGGGGGQQTNGFAGTYQGGVSTPANAVHTITFTVDANGQVTGTSTWPQTGNFNLTGTVNASGQISLTDNAQTIGFNTGIYIGAIDPNTGQAQGQYAEGDPANVLANWSAGR